MGRGHLDAEVNGLRACYEQRKKGVYWLVGQFVRLDRKSQMAPSRQNHAVYCQDVGPVAGRINNRTSSIYCAHKNS